MEKGSVAVRLLPLMKESCDWQMSFSEDHRCSPHLAWGITWPKEQHPCGHLGCSFTHGTLCSSYYLRRSILNVVCLYCTQDVCIFQIILLCATYEPQNSFILLRQRDYDNCVGCCGTREFTNPPSSSKIHSLNPLHSSSGVSAVLRCLVEIAPTTSYFRCILARPGISSMSWIIERKSH